MGELRKDVQFIKCSSELYIPKWMLYKKTNDRSIPSNWWQTKEVLAVLFGQILRSFEFKIIVANMVQSNMIEMIQWNKMTSIELDCRQFHYEPNWLNNKNHFCSFKIFAKVYFVVAVDLRTLHHSILNSSLFFKISRTTFIDIKCNCFSHLREIWSPYVKSYWFFFCNNLYYLKNSKAVKKNYIYF